jgi:hypothetical protein
VTSVLQALMLREFTWILDQAAAGRDERQTERERIVATAIRGLELITTHELFLRLLDVDPELLLPYMTHRAGRFQDAAAEAMIERLRAGMEEGSVRSADPARLAASILLALRGFAFSARAERSRRQRREALDDLAMMIDGLLRPEAP